MRYRSYDEMLREWASKMNNFHNSGHEGPADCHPIEFCPDQKKVDAHFGEPTKNTVMLIAEKINASSSGKWNKSQRKFVRKFVPLKDYAYLFTKSTFDKARRMGISIPT